MFKHTVEYKDFNGNDRKEELYFHLSLPEVTRLEAEIGKPMEEYIKELTTNKDLKTLLDFLEKMILNSYGQKTSDGKSFHKSKAIRDDFEYSQAYAEVFEQLLTNPELAKKFGSAVSDNGKAKKNQVAPQVVNNQSQQ
jgi:hypothetical protein